MPLSLDPTTESLAMWQRALVCDPLTFTNWSSVAQTQFMLGQFDSAIDTANRGLELVSHNLIAAVLIDAHIAAGQFEEASTVSQLRFDVVRNRLFNSIRIAAAQGQVVEAQTLIDKYSEEIGAEQARPQASYMTILSVMGERDKTNELAAEIDAAPLGFLTFLNTLNSCSCGAAFDLEYTPNFARLIHEADVTWPPPSPIVWPLKDW